MLGDWEEEGEGDCDEDGEGEGENFEMDSSDNTGGDSEEEADDNPPELVYSSYEKSSESEDEGSISQQRRRRVLMTRESRRRIRGEGRDRDTSEDDRGSGREEDLVNVQIVAPPNPPPLPLPAAQQGHGLQLGGQAQGELLQTRARPVIPGPERMMGDAEVDADGWAEIDRLRAWDCMLVKFAMLQEIPAKESLLRLNDGEAQGIIKIQPEGEAVRRLDMFTLSIC